MGNNQSLQCESAKVTTHHVFITCLITSPPNECPMNIRGRLISYSSVSHEVAKPHKLTSLPSLLSPKHINKSRACSTIPALLLENAGVASYPKTITLALGRSSGRKSRSHNFLLVGSVQVRSRWPLRPWIAIILCLRMISWAGSTGGKGKGPNSRFSARFASMLFSFSGWSNNMPMIQFI